MDRLHAHVGELIGHVVVGLADRMHLVVADDLRVGAGEVVLLVDQRLARARQAGDAREGDLAVAAAVERHQPVAVAGAGLGVAGADRQLARQVDVGERLLNPGVEGLGRILLAPAGQIDEDAVHAAPLKQQHGVVGAVRLADGGQHLAHGHQVRFQLEVAETAQPVQVDQTAPDALDAVEHEAVRQLEIGLILEDAGVEGAHLAPDLGQRVAPGPVRFGPGVELIDARLAGLLVLQQPVREAAVGGDHEDPVVEIRAGPLTDQDIVEDGVDVAHRRAADLVNRVLAARRRLGIAAYAVVGRRARRNRRVGAGSAGLGLDRRGLRSVVGRHDLGPVRVALPGCCDGAGAGQSAASGVSSSL